MEITLIDKGRRVHTVRIDMTGWAPGVGVDIDWCAALEAAEAAIAGMLYAKWGELMADDTLDNDERTARINEYADEANELCYEDYCDSRNEFVDWDQFLFD